VEVVFRFLVATFLATLMVGCSSFQQKNQMSAFNDAYAAGDYDLALQAVSFKTAKGSAVDADEHLLDLLHQAELQRLLGRYQEATKTYDLAEEGMKNLDLANILEKSSTAFVALMVNDSERNYQALMSEAILVNTYKSLAFLAAGNNEFARVELNRADDRTRRAVEYFSQEIAEQRKALNQQAQSGQNTAAMVRNSLNNQSLRNAVSQRYDIESEWSVLPEFMVPASTYLHGIYFLANASSRADYEKAATSLTRVAAMNRASGVLQRDAKLAEALAAGSQSITELAPQVWIVYENGLGPVLEETRIDVPLLIFHGNRQAPAYFGIALPRYRDRAAVPGSLGVISDADIAVQTERISDMGSVIRTEMKERFPSVLARAVSSAVIKAVIQNEAAENFGVWGQLGAAALTIATTQADLRSWQALPNHWQAARIDRPENGKLTLTSTNDYSLGTIVIPDQPFTLLYVKRPTLAGPASVVALDLQGRNPASTVQLSGKDLLTATQ
jgi:hypothetical protein